VVFGDTGGPEAANGGSAGLGGRAVCGVAAGALGSAAPRAPEGRARAHRYRWAPVAHPRRGSGPSGRTGNLLRHRGVLCWGAAAARHRGRNDRAPGGPCPADPVQYAAIRGPLRSVPRQVCGISRL